MSRQARQFHREFTYTDSEAVRDVLYATAGISLDDDKRELVDVQVDGSLKELIEFRQLNLMHDWPAKGPFDIIFCRNVMIYFDKPTRHRLFERYADCLADGGYLFVGRSESVHTLSGRFELVGQSIYRKL